MARGGSSLAPSPRRGEGRGEGARTPRLLPSVSRDEKLLADRFQNPIGILQHVVVPEAQNEVAVPLDDLGPRSVADWVMLAAVQFDCETRAPAGAVRDVAIDLELADEFCAFQTPVADIVPKAFLRFGLVAAKASRDRGQALSSQRRTPSPNPLPLGERAFLSRPRPSSSLSPGGRGQGEGVRRVSPIHALSNNPSPRV